MVCRKRTTKVMIYQTVEYDVVVRGKMEEHFLALCFAAVRGSRGIGWVC
jgi:hypothetical protein